MFFLAELGIRLVLYNIRYCTGAGWRHHAPFPFAGSLRTTCGRSEAVTEYIASLEPDIVGLVESDKGSFRNNGRSQPEALAERLGQQCVFSPKYRHMRLAERVPVLCHQGNAVVTGLPISTTFVHRLNRGIKNAVIETVFDDFTFMLVHLSIGQGARLQQIHELAEIASVRTKPLVLAGDFNTFGGDTELEPLMREGLKKAGPVRRPTFPSRDPRHGLDMVLHSPEISILGFDVPRVRFSDHLPVVCDFTLPVKDLTGGEDAS
ncbi:MAG: endonuclease/exonuclease/phosphatase family protein [Thermovirgaceae bacterium]|nr:endonuclease/exonuclease/phosphatase family protein [Thermovirgaceae bacterium]